MIELYHGSPWDFEFPDLSMSKSYRDFGCGFYLAENENDASSIAIKDGYNGFLYTYEVDDSSLMRLRACDLYGFSDEWAEMVYKCRMNGSQSDYDVIIGETAGGPVNDLFERYRRENPPFEAVKDEMLRLITNTRFGTQWCLATPAALSCINLVNKEPINRDGYYYY